MTAREFLPPLAVNFIWHPSDAKLVDPILDFLRESFSRNRTRPFSRELNLPLFFFSSLNPNEVPDSAPALLAMRNLIFVFTSTQTMGNSKWKSYVEELSVENVHIVPVALDNLGLRHNGVLHGLNCIRAFDWAEGDRTLSSLVFLAHEVCRFGTETIIPNELGSNSSIKLFLSHAKSGKIGLQHAEQIKQFIDDTNMNRFFDANEISPGFRFDEEIERHISSSTFLAIENDTYSSRYWCQREMLSAKHFNRPIVALNCLSDYEDRVFPGASNVPRINVASGSPLSQKDILRVLSLAMLETIRHRHSLETLEMYRNRGWIDRESELIARPLEIRQALDFIEDGKRKVCYPDPPIYAEEADWHEKLDIDTYTPLWSRADNQKLQSYRVGISISDVQPDGFSDNHLHSDHLIRFAQDLARHLLARSAVLLYGGDLRQNGFTEFILEEAAILKERLREIEPHVENHLAWPLYVSSEEVVTWRAQYSDVMQTVEHSIPEDVIEGVSSDTVLPPSSPENLYVWSRCLTEMREKSVSSSGARICAGGKLSGYKGKMPGVLEEVLIAIRLEKPLFLLGAFGGVVGEICKVIHNQEVSETLTEDWQIAHNEGYSYLQELARSEGNHSDYAAISVLLQNLDIAELSQRSGLESSDYMRLMVSPFIDECVHLIIKGLSKLLNNE